MKTTHDIIIIGGGAAGLTCASGSAQLGLKTLLIDKAHLGGDCLHYGCVPSKTLLKSAHLMRDIRRAPTFGLPMVNPFPPDLEQVMNRVRAVINHIARHDSPERFRKLGAEVEFGSPRFLSPRELSLNGKVVSAKKIVLSTGSRPILPEIPGLREANPWTNVTLFNQTRLPEHLIVLGSGPIGIELAQAFLGLGSRVTILCRGDQILKKEDSDMAFVIEKQLISEGALVLKKVKILKVESSSSGKKVIIEHKGSEKSIEGSQILAALGRRGNTEDLDLEKAGVDVTDSFISTDAALRTSSPGIYAAGDCNGRYLFTHVAGAEGSFLIRKLVFRLPGTMDYRGVPWCTYTDPELASVGLNEKRAQSQGLIYNLVESPIAELDRAITEHATEGKIKILLDRKDRIMGTQIVGPSAGELLGPSILAFREKYKMMKLVSPMIPYPTLGEIHKKAGGSYYAPKLFNPRTRKLLRLLYGYGREK